MKIYLATWSLEKEKAQGESLNKINKKERLLSYFYLNKNVKSFFKYIKTGK